MSVCNIFWSHVIDVTSLSMNTICKVILDHTILILLTDQSQINHKKHTHTQNSSADESCSVTLSWWQVLSYVFQLIQHLDREDIIWHIISSFGMEMKWKRRDIIKWNWSIYKSIFIMLIQFALFFIADKYRQSQITGDTASKVRAFNWN